MTFWNYHRISLESPEQWQAFKKYDNISERITWGVIGVCWTPIATAMLYTAMYLPFQSGEGMFVLGWLFEIMLIILNFSLWKEAIQKREDWKKL